MDFIEFQTLLLSDSKFSYLQSDPKLLNDILHKMNVIVRSGKVRDEALGFLNNQRELERYTDVAKRIAGLKIQDKPYQKSVIDKSLENASDEQIKQVLEDDARSFYYQLDYMTGGKHKFYEKIDNKLQEVNFERNLPRSGVGCNEINGQVVWHINVDIAPLVNNRTVANHELWHSIDEKNLHHDSQIGGGEQFIGEIGTMFIDKLSYDYMLKTHADDPQLIEGLKYLQSIEWNNDVIKAKEAYLDVVLCQALYGDTEEIRDEAQKTILNNFGTVWSPRIFGRMINKLYDVATIQDHHFDPMYELRYIVGRVVSDAVYDKDIPTNEKIDKMAELNNNVVTLNNLPHLDNESPIDVVTNHLGVSNLEQLVENYAQQIIQARDKQLQGIRQ